jgi:predicted ATPase
LAYNFNLNRFGGSKNFILDKSSEPQLNKFAKVVKELNKPKDAFFFRSDTFFNLGKELIKYNCPAYDYSGDKSFKEQSHGESFMSFFKNRIGTNGLYFFDEPETALSFDNQILFLFLLKQFENDDNQIFIITHSPILLSYPNAQIIEIEKDSINEVKFENTKQYLDLKHFLENYKSYQKQILDF